MCDNDIFREAPIAAPERGGVGMSSGFIGQIMMFAGSFAPAGWALCDGRLLQISDNDALFKVIGTSYGGDGTVTFALPDLRGRVPLGQGAGPGLSSYQLGQKVGAESVALTAAQIPSHAHLVNAVNGPGNTNIPANNTLLSGVGGQAASGQYQTPAYAPPSANQISLAGNTVSSIGDGQPHPNLQPFLVFSFCIAVSVATS
jgi:microcystin-dependent protein